MDIARIIERAQILPAPLPLRYAEVSSGDWLPAAQAIRACGGRLISLWGNAGPTQALSVSAAYALREGLLWLTLPLADAEPAYPDLSSVFPYAARMQRATADLLGVNAQGQQDSRPWLNHGAWPRDYYPLRHPDAADPVPGPTDEYTFVRVQGQGVHEIPVGPVHAGIIEPGHFRFSVVGEKVLRLEERLGYTHKGIERRFTTLSPLAAHRLAGRVSGDSTVAFSWAYCMALESAAACSVPPRAAWLRALLLERERVANHLGDLGALGNDAALAFALTQFSRLREDWQRASAQIFGHRLLMDCVVPGGVAQDPDRDALAQLCRQCDVVEAEVTELSRIFDEHPGLQDRFITTGRLSAKQAAELGLTGLAGRASAQALDLRCDQVWTPYDVLDAVMATRRNGDVAARAAVRFDELFESLRLIRAICDAVPGGSVRTAVNMPAASARGAGWIEGWRGEVLVALELSADGQTLQRCHCHDPSWQNWPALEYAIIGNIVADFPLINKSFNLSYAGHDL